MNGVFDTNILVDYLNGAPQAASELSRYGSRSISVVTWIEVLVGCRDDLEAQAARTLLSTFGLVEIPAAIAERAILLRQSRRLKLPDAVVLATALETRCVLVTRNTKDFPPADPAIRVPYTL